MPYMGEIKNKKYKIKNNCSTIRTTTTTTTITTTTTKIEALYDDYKIKSGVTYSWINRTAVNHLHNKLSHKSHD